MKNFLLKNWYRLMIGSSLFMASLGFFIHSISPAFANGENTTFKNSNYKMIPVSDDGTILVKLTDEQLDRIIPKNEDGSINIQLSDKQMNEIATSGYGDVIDVNIVEISGHNVAYCADTPGAVSLGVCN